MKRNFLLAGVIAVILVLGVPTVTWYVSASSTMRSMTRALTGADDISVLFKTLLISLYCIFVLLASTVMFLRPPSVKKLCYMSVFLYLVLFIGFLWRNPGQYVCLGVDNSQALAMATSALLRGEFPYGSLTTIGNPISPLPGSLILAMPFLLLGNVGLQFFLCIIIYVMGLRYLMESWEIAVAIAFTPFLLFVPAWQGVIFGQDYLTNSMVVFLAAMLVFKSAKSSIDFNRKRRWICSSWSIILGICLSSRMAYMLIMPVLATALFLQYGWRTTWMSLLLTGTSFLCVTLPIYMWDPSNFSPLHTSVFLSNAGPYGYAIVLGCWIAAAWYLRGRWLENKLNATVLSIAMGFVFVIQMTALVYIGALLTGKNPHGVLPLVYPFLFPAAFGLFWTGPNFRTSLLSVKSLSVKLPAACRARN
jgi:hypothetical protein